MGAKDLEGPWPPDRKGERTVCASVCVAYMLQDGILHCFERLLCLCQGWPCRLFAFSQNSNNKYKPHLRFGGKWEGAKDLVGPWQPDRMWQQSVCPSSPVVRCKSFTF